MTKQHEVLVVDWTQLENAESNYAVVVNNQAKFMSDDVKDCHNVAHLIRSAYNQGVSDAKEVMKQAAQSLEVRASLFDRTVLVVTPEMAEA